MGVFLLEFTGTRPDAIQHFNQLSGIKYKLMDDSQIVKVNNEEDRASCRARWINW